MSARSENARKSSEYAQYMKRNGITRTTSMCPWGCGAKIANGGSALLNHLNRCLGGGRRRFKN